MTFTRLTTRLLLLLLKIQIQLDVHSVMRFGVTYKSYSSLNIAVDLSLMKSVLSNTLMEFVELSNHHKDLNNKSFVIVTGPIALKLLPNQDMNVVPTLHEALDTVEIEGD